MDINYIVKDEATTSQKFLAPGESDVSGRFILRVAGTFFARGEPHEKTENEYQRATEHFINGHISGWQG